MCTTLVHTKLITCWVILCIQYGSLLVNLPLRVRHVATKLIAWWMAVAADLFSDYACPLDDRF